MEGLKQGSYTRTEGRASANTYPRFFTDSVKDHVASAREGRDIFKAEERVEIIMPGISQLTKPVERVTQEHIDRWPEEYKRFKSGQEMSADGVPLEQWPILKREMVLELKYLGFMTVEQIADMSEHAIQRIPMMGRRLKELAKAYLDDEQAGALLAKTTAQNEKMAAIVAEQNEKIANQAAMLEKLSATIVAMQNAPSAIETHIPGRHDPVEAFRQTQPEALGGESALASLPAPRARKGRANAETAA